jgi:hypothetical protein
LSFARISANDAIVPFLLYNAYMLVATLLLCALLFAAQLLV